MEGKYATVKLTGDGEEVTYKISRLIASTFLPTPDNLSDADHIDGDPTNNHVTNLRWLVHKENMQAYNDNFRKKRAILQYDLNGKLIKKWNCMTELREEYPKYNSNNIYYHIRKQTNSAYGYKWAYETPIIRIKPNPNEKFKPIKRKYNGYSFSNYGISKNGNIIHFKKNLLKTKTKDKNGYEMVNLYCKNTGKEVTCKVHRLVAHVYSPIKNINPKIQVNHADKKRDNNSHDNLGWATHQENMAHALGKMVRMIDIETGEVLKIFRCISDAGRYFGKKTTNIGQVCNGNKNKCQGYKWEFVKKGDTIDQPIISVPIKYNIDNIN